MKKMLVVITMLSLLFTSSALTAFADDAVSAKVYVTVSDKGNLLTAQKEVNVTDIDSDGKLTVNDALYAVHEASFDGGANAGYGYYIDEIYGLCLSKLWGDESGNFGYYLNDESCWSLADSVKDGDRVTAFIYSDSKYFSDTYSFFNINTVSVKSGEEIELTLMCSGFDENWNPVSYPLENAVITVNGEKTQYATDENGTAIVKIDSDGEYVISAVSDNKVLVSPVCTAVISSDSNTEPVPDTGDNINLFFALILLSASLLYVAGFVKRKAYEA